MLSGERTADGDTRLKATLQQSTAGGSGSFLGLAEDGARYWIKPLNNAQGQRVPITEQIVGRVGALIGAPTCHVCTISIPPDLAGWEFRPGRQLEAGIAHACEHVEDAVETRALDHHVDDDNARRHACAAALYDWCWGGDLQGLLAVTREYRFFSHDHGWFLPPEGPSWSAAELLANVDAAHELAVPAHHSINATIAEAIAAALEAITRDHLREALAGIPASWPVSDEELECVGYFLEKRAPVVATRIRQRFRSVS